MKTITYFSALSLSLFISSCAPQSAENGKTEEHHHHEGASNHIEISQQQMNTVDIQLGTVRKIELGGSLKVNGSIEVSPTAVADVAPMFSGIVSAINVTEGQRVTAGMPVAYIDNADVIDIQQQYLEAIEEASLASIEYDRQQMLNSQGAGVLKNLQQAETADKIARAKVDGLASRLRLAGISLVEVSNGTITSRVPVKSPISGIVSGISAVVGSYADMSAPLLSIVDNSNVYCILRVYEQDIDRVAVGQDVIMKLTNGEDTQFSGTVEKINHTLDPVTKTMSVRVKIDADSDLLLVPSMAVSAIINTGSRLEDALPSSAFVASGGKNYLFRLEDVEDEGGTTMYHFDKVEVITLNSELGMTSFLLADGKEAGDSTRFVTANAFYLGSATSDHGEHDH